MNTPIVSEQWQQKLSSFGLEQVDGDFAYPAEPTAVDALSTLASETVLHVGGEDAEAFLHLQFSNEIRNLANPGSQLSTWSSPKGRVISLFRIIRVEDGYLIKLPHALSDPILKRLQMFASISRSTEGKAHDVVVAAREDLIAIGISGESAEKTLREATCAPGAEIDDTCVASGDAWVTRVRGEFPRFEVIGTVERVAELWQACLSGGSVMADESMWRLQNIDAGIPSVDAQTTEAFVLQMMNLHHINGVNFKKGCFPGQEVVARMQYLGKLKRQMYRLSFKYREGDALPVSGDEIFKAGGGSAAGKIVDVAKVDQNSGRLLAVVAIDATEEPLYLDSEAQQELQLMTLPYSLTAAE